SVQAVASGAGSTVNINAAGSKTEQEAVREGAREGVREALSENKPHPSEQVSMVEECNSGFFPVTIPPGEALNIVPTNRKYVESRNSGTLEIRNLSLIARQYPDTKTMSNIDKYSAPSSVFYRCQISNLGTSNVVSAAIDLELYFTQRDSKT